MEKFFLVLKITKQITFLLLFKIANSALRICKMLFSAKTIVFISKNRIHTIHLGAKLQFLVLLMLLWLGNFFHNSLMYNSIISQKNQRISALSKANQKFASEVDKLHENLSKISDYFLSVSNYDHLKIDPKITKEMKKLNRNKEQELFSGIKLSRSDKKVAEKIVESNLLLDNIKQAAGARIAALENKLTELDLGKNGKAPKNNNWDNADEITTEISLNNEDLSKAQG